MTLMADAARVIEIRVRMMALGQSTPAEMFRTHPLAAALWIK